jgi:cellulose synthase/poly-beta-1,6-N-acetylglucosamine synthase-like glycosyltransferase
MELIVVDDGSMDRTAAIAREFASADERIKYVFQSNKKLAGRETQESDKQAASLSHFSIPMIYG